MSENGKFKYGDTILFRDGDTFRGGISIQAGNILLGSYGDISKGKPKIYRSPYDGTKTGKWTEVKKNIWKYQVDGKDALTNDVGTIWGFCKKGNKNCSKSMDSLDRTFEYAFKVSTLYNYSETDLESKIDTLLTEDMQFYHAGHGMNANGKAKALYLYSTSNPATRFDEIEFSMGGNVISYQSAYSDLHVDNLNIAFTGSHGIGMGTKANLKVTNCEIGFIGGSAQSYYEDTKKIIRFGNAIEIYGSVMPMTGYDVKEGFVVDNNYIYQCYDAGPTFQYSTEGITRADRVRFTNNVLEYNNYNIEYWNETKSTDSDSINGTYIKDFVISGNIFRHAGRGLCETRHNQGQSAHIKTWNANERYNRVNGQYIIENNIFEDAREQYLYIRAPRGSLPIMRNNTYYGDYFENIGYYYSEPNPINTYILGEAPYSDVFKNDKFVISGKPSFENKSGTSGGIKWSYNASTKTLSITGTEMPDYTEGKAPWYSFKDGIDVIDIADTVTKIGNYAFYNLLYLKEIRLNSTLKDFSYDSANANYGTNYIFYKAGHNSVGITLKLGPKVTSIPRMFSQPSSNTKEGPKIAKIIFNGNNLKTLKNYAFSKTVMLGIRIPEGLTTISGLSLGNGTAMEQILLPSTLNSLSNWSLAGNYYLKKVVVAGEVNTVGSDVFYSDTKVSTLVIPSIKNPDNYSGKLFNPITASRLTVYGDSSVKTFVDNVLADSTCTNKNVVYKDISEYKVKIKSNEGLNITKNFKDSYTFTTTKSVNAYYAVDTDLYAGDVDITKNGNTYTISNIISDIYIDLK